MNEREIRAEIVQDLRIGNGRVLYLEDRGDVAMFLALLGVPVQQAIPDEGRVHESILIRGLKVGRGSGGNAVRQRVEVAEKFGYAGVRGVVDGDGEPYTELARRFDPPHAGQLHCWKAYCIENLLAQVGWPTSWPELPDWRALLRTYLPYAALNAAVRRIQSHLTALGVMKFLNPQGGQPLRTLDELERQLDAAARSLPTSIDALAIFREGVAAVDTALARPELHEAHALINGKWLVEVEAPTRTGQHPETCKSQWIRFVAELGGHPEVRAWWRRFVG